MATYTASWIIYKYLVPRDFKEWRNVGLIHAFIIALYADRDDIPWLHMSGHLWASLFGWGTGMAMVEMIIGYAFVFAGISLIIKGWKRIYDTKEEKKLVTDGVYRYIRHPQYTGIYLAVLGQLIHWPTQYMQYGKNKV